MPQEFVYHVSAEQGTGVFKPRPFWHDADMIASGMIPQDVPAPVGPIAPHTHPEIFRMAEQAGVHLPQGLFISEALFASDHPWPMCFAPPEIKRLGLYARPAELTGIPIAASYPASGPNSIVFEQKDEQAMRHHKFSIYTFDAQHFCRIPSGEFLARNAVFPLKETAHEDSLQSILESGVNVAFVADIEGCYQTLKGNGAHFWFMRHVVGAVKDRLNKA